jgi:hypothetical protein
MRQAMQMGRVIEEISMPLSRRKADSNAAREAMQTRDQCVAKNATLRASRADPSLRKERSFRTTSKLHLYRKATCLYTLATNVLP